MTAFPLAAFHGMAGDLWFLSHGAQGIQWSGWLLLLALAAGPTLLGFGLYNISLAAAAGGGQPDPVAGVGVHRGDRLFPAGESMNQLQLLGSALVMGGVLLLKSKTAEA